MNKIKILYLYSELMGYQLPIFKEYVSSFGAEVHVMHWDHKKLTPFVIPSINGVSYYKRSEYTLKQLKEFLLKTNPDIIYTSGWMDIGYLKAIRPLRKKGVPVVTGFDDIWFKTFRQKVASIIFPLIKPFFFSHAWVAGPYQYEFAKRLEFKNNEIIFNCLSADLDIFNQVYNQKNKIKKRNFPHKFLYVGRFESVKGVDILIEAWNNLTSSNLTKDWTLTLIGSGSLVLEDLMINDSIIIKPFLQPEKLVQKIGDYGCFVVPSRKEPWGLVLHEFSAAGLPIICSDECGAAPLFIVPNYNGYMFKALDIEDLVNQMLKIINMSDDQLVRMSQKSHFLGQRITPEISAASFMSIIDKPII